MITLKDCQLFTDGEWLVTPADDSVKVLIETDSRKDCSDSIFVAFEGDRFDAHNFLEAVLESGVKSVCVHKVPSKQILQTAKANGVGVLKVEGTVKAYQCLATGKLSKSDCVVIGITGSSGKTSTKAILSHMLETLLLEKFYQLLQIPIII